MLAKQKLQQTTNIMIFFAGVLRAKAYLCCFTQFTVDQPKLTVNGSVLSDTPNVRYLVALFITCADPGIFVRVGGRGSRPICHEKAPKTFCLDLNLFYRSPNVISKKTVIFQDSRGGLTFSREGGGGCPTFYRGGGSNYVFSFLSDT